MLLYYCIIIFRGPAEDGFQELRSLWLTAGAKEAARGSGKLYHEIQLISDLSNPQVGWMFLGLHFAGVGV